MLKCCCTAGWCIDVGVGFADDDLEGEMMQRAVPPESFSHALPMGPIRLKILSSSLPFSTKNNFSLWETQVLFLVESQDLLGFLTGETHAPEQYLPQENGQPILNAEYMSWVRTDRLVKSWIIRTLSEEVWCHVVGLQSSSEVWHALKIHFSHIPIAGMAAASDWEVLIDAEKEKLTQNVGTEAEAWNKVSIYRVPTYMCNDNGMAFRPQVVSLGPYHHGERSLSLMEAAKKRALVHLLRDTQKSVTYYLKELKDSLETAMEAYEQLDEKWMANPKEFLQMMLLDGCFVIEILWKNTRYAISDPVFGQRQPTIIQYLKRDMLLLENQLPLAFLQKLGDIIATETRSTCNINSLLLENFSLDNKKITSGVDGMHMLDVARQSMLNISDMAAQGQKVSGRTSKSMARLHEVWNNTKRRMNGSCFADRRQGAAKNVKSNEIIKKSGTKRGDAWIRLKQITKTSWCVPMKLKANDKRSTKNSRSAKELHQVGINFQRSESNGLRKIEFTKDSLHLPTITIDHNSESMFLNFIAFEQLHLNEDRFMTSYFLFMGGLITSIEDVKLLRDNEIIESSVANEIPISRMMEKLTTGLSFSQDDKLYKIQQELNDYYLRSEKRCKRKAKTWYSNMCNTYFASPWTIIKLAAGFSLLGLTAVSTIYTILQLYKRNP